MAKKLPSCRYQSEKQTKHLLLFFISYNADKELLYLILKGGINYGRLFGFLFMDVVNYDTCVTDRMRVNDIYRNYTVSDQVAG